MKKKILFASAALIISSMQIFAQNDTAKEGAKNNNKSDSVTEQVAPVFTIVELMPVFPGGEKSMYKWLIENLKYPQIAREAGIQGTVYINFVIEKDGSISNVNCLRAIGGGCDEEAMRVVKSMPKWEPGKQKGEPARVYFNLPVKFILR